MGMAKEESEKAFGESKYSCFRCGEKILLNDLKFAQQDKDNYLCPDCKAELEKIKDDERIDL